jgi:hypothetical protein
MVNDSSARLQATGNGRTIKVRPFIQTTLEDRAVPTKHTRLVPARTDIFITCRGGARYLAIAQNSFKILSHPDDNGNVLNQSSMDIDLFNTNLSDAI